MAAASRDMAQAGAESLWARVLAKAQVAVPQRLLEGRHGGNERGRGGHKTTQAGGVESRVQVAVAQESRGGTGDYEAAWWERARW